MLERTLGIHVHEEWKGMTQPVGLVVEPLILDRLGIFPEKDIKVISDLQRRLSSLLEDEIQSDKILCVIKNFKDFCKEVLGWQDCDLLTPESFLEEKDFKDISVFLEDYGEILQPDWIVPNNDVEDNENKIQILVKELEIGTSFDQVIKTKENKKNWEATPQQKFERLLKETENPIGIIWNGIAIRLVYAPRGESSGHITFLLDPMTTVDGRPMIGALEMLLGEDRLFEGGSSNLRLRKLMELSRKEQNEVSTRLSEQVLEALWILLKGLDEAEKKANYLGKTILGDLPDKDPSHIYGGLITVLLRLVFLLYSEDEELMPKDSLFSENYSISGLASKLRNDRTKYQSGMEGRVGAWGSLLSLFRLIFDGGGPNESYLPARHGELFDPDNYPFLEGRTRGTNYKGTTIEILPPISDDVVERVLTKLLILDGQILSYRSLDVEQIGSIYEGIMGFEVERVSSLSLGILYRPPRQKINLTYIFNVSDFLAQDSSKRESWLKDTSGVDLKLSNIIKTKLKESKNIDELCAALGNKLSPYTERGLPAGSLILQPSLERRSSGSHYTPRSLTEPIVRQAISPWLNLHGKKPSAKEILALKVCDPAMGSGAFLVAVCRYLADLLVNAWEREGLPVEFNESFDKDIYARRLIAQNCLYGVDKNPFAVNLAKLSLWLVTLSRDLPFTFLDHSLKSGDSLVGYTIQEIKTASNELQLSIENLNKKEIEKLVFDRKINFSQDCRDDQSYDFKKNLVLKHYQETEKLRKAGDIMVSAFFDAKKDIDRKKNKDFLLSLLNNKSDEFLIEKKRNLLKNGLNQINPFHWEIEFPEIFSYKNKGFDVFVGNPPFISSTNIYGFLGPIYRDWIDKRKPLIKGRAVDLVAHFFRHSFDLLKDGGALCFIATNTICQGDTREAGLSWICKNNGIIFWKQKRSPWPGTASVTISKVGIVKSLNNNHSHMPGLEASNSYLMPGEEPEDLKTISANKGLAFIGHKFMGEGFVFTDSGKGNTTKKEIAIEIMKDNLYKEVIFKFSGAKEILSKPDSSPDRFIICFGKRPLSLVREKYPKALSIVEEKVFPERQKMGGYSVAEKRKEYWWQFGTYASALENKLHKKDKCLVVPIVSSNLVCEFLPSNIIFSHSSIIFCDDSWKLFGLLQSTLHLEWSLFRGSTMGDGLRYTPTDCFETIVLPWLNSRDPNHPNYEGQYIALINEFSNTAKKYHAFRTEIKKTQNIGLTEIYNRFNDPFSQSEEINNLRNIHTECEKLLLNLYSWQDLNLIYGFELDYLDLQEDIEIPVDIKDKITCENLFFNNFKEAILFTSRLKDCGALKRNHKLPWKYRWPRDVRDTVIARLIKLNNEFNKREICSTYHENKPSQKSLSEDKKDGIQIGLDI